MIAIRKVSVSREFASGVLTAALEAPYTRQWATIEKHTRPGRLVTKAVLIDQEADPNTRMVDRRHVLTIAKMQRAIEFLICHWRDVGLKNTRIVGLFLSDNVDGVAADVAVQVACFKKVIYG